MAFRFYRRVNLGGGLGLNLSKSGLSPSIRSRYGSIGPEGFLVRTGIPGLSFRGGKKQAGEAVLFLLLIMAAVAAISLATIVIWNLLRLVCWVAVEIYHFSLRQWLAYKTFRSARIALQQSLSPPQTPKALSAPIQASPGMLPFVLQPHARSALVVPSKCERGDEV